LNQKNDKLWHQQHEKLVKSKQADGNRLVPNKHKQDQSPWIWFANNDVGPRRKQLLDKVGLACKHVTLAAWM
jgi:hypothetical protein